MTIANIWDRQWIIVRQELKNSILLDTSRIHMARASFRKHIAKRRAIIFLNNIMGLGEATLVVMPSVCWDLIAYSHAHIPTAQIHLNNSLINLRERVALVASGLLLQETANSANSNWQGHVRQRIIKLITVEARWLLNYKNQYQHRKNAPICCRAFVRRGRLCKWRTWSRRAYNFLSFEFYSVATFDYMHRTQQLSYYLQCSYNRSMRIIMLFNGGMQCSAAP